MFHTPASAIKEAEQRAEVPKFKDSDRASAIVKRLENGDEIQQSVAALIKVACDDFKCPDCSSESDTFVFMLEDADENHHLAVACPVCDAEN